jgi:hypothetical protein
METLKVPPGHPELGYQGLRSQQDFETSSELYMSTILMTEF